MRSLLFAATLLVSGLPLRAAEPCITLDDKSVAALFDQWNFTLSSLDATQVTQRYWPNAVLLPTVSNTPRTNAAMIADYFEHFLVKRPRGHIDSRTIQSGCNMAVDMGTYTFSLMDDKGTTTEVAARYTFIYEYRDGAWKILHHHSSAMPEAGKSSDAALVANDGHAEASTPAPVKQAKSRSRRDRLPKHKDYLQAKPAAELKATAEPKANPQANAHADAKPASDAKPTADKKPPDAPSPADATPADIRTAMFANLTSSPPPSKFYPPESARRKERGSVNLKVCADSTGEVSDSMEVVRSSGSKLLDEAAMTWAREATWVPATYNRKRVEGCATVDVSFEPLPGLAHARP